MALDWFLPPLCLGCRGTPEGGIDAFNLCAPCRRLLRPLRGQRCRTCPAPLADASAPADFTCGDCRRRPPAWDRLLAAWSYEAPMREVVLGLKFGRLEYLADSLAADLAGRFAGELATCDAVVPVPLHWRRSLARGYNQAHLLARSLARELGRPFTKGLTRRRSTRAQTGLDRAGRRRNLRGAFRPTRRSVEGLHVALVDDVYTTGATLDSAARALRRAGAASVTAVVVAATPDPGN